MTQLAGAFVLISLAGGETEYVGAFSTMATATAHIQQAGQAHFPFMLIRPELDVPDFANDQWQWDTEDHTWRWTSGSRPEPSVE